MSLVDAVGWAGALGVLVAYAMITRAGVTMRAQAINAAAAVALVIEASAHGAAPVVALNLAWVIIALAGMLKLRKAE